MERKVTGWLAMSAFGLAFGAFPGSAGAQPSNDLCSGAIPLTCGESVIGNTSTATVDTAPACTTTNGTGGGVWYSLIGTGSPTTIQTCGAGTTFDTRIRVYTGSCGALVCVAGNDNSLACASPTRAWVQWNSVAGVEYLVLVHGTGAASGGIEVAASCYVLGPEDCDDTHDNDGNGLTDCEDAECAPLALCTEDCDDGIDNNGDGFVDCSDAQCQCDAACPPALDGDQCCDPIDAFIGINIFSMIPFSTIVSPDPWTSSQCPGTGPPVYAWDKWLRWVAPASGTVAWNTCWVPVPDQAVVVYQGDDCRTKTQIACNGDGPPLPGNQCFWYSTGEFDAIAGETYHIRFSVNPFSFPTYTTEGLYLEYTGCPAIANLTAANDCATGAVTLEWDPASFDSFDVRKDNAPLATGLPGTSSEYVDPDPGDGFHDYELIGHCAGLISATVSVQAAHYDGEQDLIIRGESPSLVDSAGALAAELAALGRSVVVFDGGIADYPCAASPFAVIWQMLGTWPAYRCVSAADGAILGAAHAAGASIYTEGGDQWGYCVPVAGFGDLDGIASAIDGDDGFTAMDGSDSGLGLDLADLLGVPYTQDTTGDDYTDRLVAATADPGLSATGVVWRRDDALGVPTYDTGVAGIGAAASGRVVSQSWEFGGFGGSRADLAARLVAFLDPAPVTEQLRRGDCNDDGAIDIGDAIWTLSRLFSGGPPGTCDDACDANDDGGVDIGDAITVLNTLFGGAGPLPSPYPDCGADPVADALGCANSTTCP